MKNRILTIINLEKISAAQMASLLGIQRSTLSNIIGGRNKPSYDILNSILTKFPNLNFEWLMNGKGNPYKDPDKNLRGESLFTGSVENSTKEPEIQSSSPTSPLEVQNTPSEDNLFSYTPSTEEVSEDFPLQIDEEFHPFPVLEEGELGKRVEMLQKSKNENVAEIKAPAEPSENGLKPANKHIAEEKNGKKIERIQIFFSDGTFQEFR